MKESKKNTRKDTLLHEGKKGHVQRDYRQAARRLAAVWMTLLTLVVYGSYSFPVFAQGISTPENRIEQMARTVSGGDHGGGSKPAAPPEEEDTDDDEEEGPLFPEVSQDDELLDNAEEEALKNLQGVDQYGLDDIIKPNKGTYKKPENNKNKGNHKTIDLADGNFSRDDWRLVLINKQHPIPDDYTFNLGTISGNMRCDDRILDDLLEMMSAAREDGIELVICSPYRDMERQEMLFARKIKRYMNSGLSYMEAYKESSQTVTVPGASEHQVGLALDIVSNGYSALDEGFGDTQAGKWLAENRADYGFILRYPKGKEYITGISYEPWHFRYVGMEAATVIMDNSITLEEFWEDL